MFNLFLSRSKQPVIRTLWLCLVLGSTALANETDQFTLPKEPLTDISEALTQKVYGNIQKTVNELNGKIARALRLAENPQNELVLLPPQYYRRRISDYLSRQALADQIYQTMGPGLPVVLIEAWLNLTDFHQKNARFEPFYTQTIFEGAGWSRPGLYLFLSPTINVFGVNMGTDKIGHFFQQGYEYWQVFDRQTQNGANDSAANREAVALGIQQEKGMFGRLLTGVYSNGDMAANYAGMKFYINLTSEVRVGDRVLPPLLLRADNQWTFNPQRRTEDLLKPFITEHLNEAFNPPVYEPIMRISVRPAVRSRCADWLKAHPGTTRSAEAERLDRLQTWFGEEYGHSRNTDELVTIENTCFND